MRRFLLTLTTLLAVAAGPVSADTRSVLEGRWKNGKMEIVIAPCGTALCGRVVKASAKQQAQSERASGANLLGERVIDNIKPSGPRTWRADVFVASRNMNTSGTIEQVGPDRLAVHGCVLLVICKTTHWDRVG